jgi:hypothetical protein
MEDNKPIIRIYGRLPEGKFDILFNLQAQASVCTSRTASLTFLSTIPIRSKNIQNLGLKLLLVLTPRHLLENSLNMGLQKENAIRLCLLVRGTRFYGYAEETLFVKIYYRNPAMKNQICMLLQSGNNNLLLNLDKARSWITNTWSTIHSYLFSNSS